MNEQNDYFMHQALTLAREGISLGHGGPFGAVVVIEGEIVGRGWNQVVHLKDPTAHAEILAIREACTTVGHFHLPNAILYTTCEPCPMCMGALYWSRISKLIYGATGEDAASVGFDDRQIKDEIRKSLSEQNIDATQRLHNECRDLFQQWQSSDKRIDY